MNSHDEDDEFEDALDDIEPLPESMTLEKAIAEAQKSIDLFFNNQFHEARNIVVPYSKNSMYHALGNAVFYFLEAVLTFEPDNIRNATKALKESIAVCNRFRKKNTFGESLNKMVNRCHYDQYTEEEAHAELCYAESLILKSVLTFIEDETLSSFIKGGLKIKSCHNCYKDCNQILRKRNWDNSSTKLHFESGVKQGIGSFNLMISMLPSRIIKLLEFIGFTGDKQQGLDDLISGYKMGGLRQILNTMTLLGYHLMVLYVVSHGEGDLNLCEDILNQQIKKYPNGCWFLFFNGRKEFMRGNLDLAKEWYVKSWKSQDIWKQFHHVCFWELFWIECAKTNWKQALIYSNYLLEGSKWSRSIYTYQKAAIMLMLNDENKSTIQELMSKVPKYKQRIAGKSLPMEKFVVKKSERYFNQKQNLVVPVIELMYIWNIFKSFHNFQICDNLLQILDSELTKLDTSSIPLKYHHDNRALLLLLKGAVLKYMDSPLQSLECFEEVISMQKKISEDNYLVPYAIVELALIEWSRGKKEKAVLALEDAKKNYTGYSLESRLHFRIHTALCQFKPELKNT